MALHLSSFCETTVNVLTSISFQKLITILHDFPCASHRININLHVRMFVCVQGLFMYWLSSSFFSMGQIYLLKLRSFRSLMGIPELIIHENTKKDSEGFIATLKSGKSGIVVFPFVHVQGVNWSILSYLLLPLKTCQFWRCKHCNE